MTISNAARASVNFVPVKLREASGASGAGERAPEVTIGGTETGGRQAAAINFAPLRQESASVPAPQLIDTPPAPPVATDFKGGILSTLFSCAGHALLVFAVIYAVGSAGSPEQTAENPVEIEIIVEAAAAASALQVAPETVIDIELPPPVPDPIIEVELPIEQPPPEPEPEPPVQVAEAPVPVPTEVPVEPPEPEVKLDLPEPPPAPEFVFEPPPPTVAETPAAVPVPQVVPKPQPKPVDEEQKRQQEIARQKRIAERQKERQLEEARERAREKARQAAQQQSRAAAPRQAPQVNAGRNGSAQANAPRGNSSLMSIDAFKAAVAARVARNRPAASTAASAQGVVVVAFSVTASGGASGVHIARSSGHGVLDQAALSAVRRAAPFPAPPPGAPRSFSVPMRFNAR
jgi:protein TonB